MRSAVSDPASTANTTQSECHLCDHQEPIALPEGQYWKIFEVPEIEDAHGLAGQLVKKLGVASYAIFFIVPLTFVAVFFAIVPFGDPVRKSFKEQWVFLLISNVAVVSLYVFLYEATFLSLAERERPFRVSFLPIIVCVLAQIAMFAPLLLLHGAFNYLGIVSLALVYITLFLSLLVAYPSLADKVHLFFRRFVFLIALYIPIIVAYIVGYRDTGAGGQAGLSIAIAFVTFIYRRIMLSRLDPFPLDLAQLLSGCVTRLGLSNSCFFRHRRRRAGMTTKISVSQLHHLLTTFWLLFLWFYVIPSSEPLRFWVQNIFDVVQIVAFPQVQSPTVFLAIWFANSFGNFAFLGKNIPLSSHVIPRSARIACDTHVAITVHTFVQ
jgi:hypothetical protein